ncbi:MAG: GH3 auxin-responsive promoter family protein [Bacteroidota bacterium]
MGILRTLITKALEQRFRRIDRMRREPLSGQQAIFKTLLQAGKNTAFGRAHHFAQIRSYADFTKQVPVSPYEELYPYIERMLKGEQNVLWNTPVTQFSKSSGTTNARSKFIPVSAEALRDCHYKAGADLISIYLEQKPGSRVLQGKNLGIGGSLGTHPQYPQSITGDISALIMKNLPWWAQIMRTPTLDVALMDRWEEKIERIARLTINEDVTSLGGVPTWTVALLRRVMEIKGTNNLLDVWPNLEVFLHGAVSFVPYRGLFREMIPGAQMSYIESYNASEGFFAIQDDLGLENQMLLMTEYGIFYEFIPAEHVGTPHAEPVPLEGVKPGINYAIVISTNAGLWRYLIGDTVRFTSTDPYRICISGRTRNFINAFGEELIVENAETAISRACAETGALVSNFTAAPVYMQRRSKGGHEWLIEFAREPQTTDIFAASLDKHLRSLNSDYDAKRSHDIALEAPIVQAVPPGTFAHWLGRQGKLGGQHKVPRLSNSREYVDEIAGMLQASGG